MHQDQNTINLNQRNQPEFPHLPIPSKNEIKELPRAMSKNKPVAYDGISDNIFHIHGKCAKPNTDNESKDCSKKIQFCRSIWDKDYWCTSQSNTHFQARLLPLNKVHPKTPSANQYRPIVISSPILKMAESYVKKKLLTFCKDEIEPEQVGFVKGFNINVNLYRLGNIIRQNQKKRRGRKKLYLLFVDFKAAFDSVRRDLLYETLTNRNILTEQEVQLVRFLHHKLSIHLDQHKCSTSRGVPQGSAISPLLFNIYIDSLIKELKRGSLSTSKTLAYADDILFCTYDQSELVQKIKTIEEWSSRNGMQLNKNKSGILTINRKEEMQEGENIEGIPLVRTYKYLGIIINEKFDIKDHIKSLKRKINFIQRKFFYVFRKNSVKFRINSFQVFMSPLFSHLNGILYFMNQTEKMKIINLWKRTFKKFLGIKINTRNELLMEFLPYDFKERLIQDTIRYDEKLKERLDECLDRTIEQKQNFFQRNQNLSPNKIQSSCIDSITTLLNLIGKKCEWTNRRIKEQDLKTYFNTDLEKVIRHALDPPPHVESSPYLLALDRLMTALKNNGIRGVTELILPDRSAENISISSANAIEIAVRNAR